MTDVDVPEHRWLAQLRLTAPGGPLEHHKVFSEQSFCGMFLKFGALKNDSPPSANSPQNGCSLIALWCSRVSATVQGQIGPSSRNSPIATKIGGRPKKPYTKSWLKFPDYYPPKIALFLWFLFVLRFSLGFLLILVSRGQ